MMFGDTLRNSTFAGRRFVHNSALMFSHACATVILPIDQGAVIPERADGVGYWPMSIAKVSRPGYDLVGVMSQRVRGSRQAMKFQILGPGLAIFRVDRGKAPLLLVLRDLGADSTDMKRPVWGAAAWIGSDGWVYLYGTSHPGKAHGTAFGWALSVARSRLEDVLEPQRWRYWDGTSWQPDARRAKVLLPAIRGVSQTLSVFQRGNRWYAISKRDDYLGTDLVIWTAASPTGPFRSTPPVAQIPSDLKTGLYRYMPLAHPRPAHRCGIRGGLGLPELPAMEPPAVRSRPLPAAVPASTAPSLGWSGTASNPNRPPPALLARTGTAGISLRN